jgi:hypothetical protein
MENETEKRKEALELAIKTAAVCPDFFSKSATSTERTLGAMIVREAKTIYGYLFQEEKQ